MRSGDPVRLGDYWLATRLGSGGQGVVYEAYDAAANRVAVKLLHPHLVGDPAFRRRFGKEVRALRRVPPFCTARVIGHDLEGERPYIVSEFVPGPSLRRAVNQGGPLDGDALHRLAISIATALAAIHRAHVVHRDLKPENVLLGPDGPRVIDFGIARTSDASAATTEELMGTPSYMAPELFSGGQAEPAADVFAWGAVVLFAATGRDAFTGPAPVAVINRLLTHDPDLGMLPGKLRGLVGAALSKDPASRPSAQRLLLGLLGDDAPPGDLPPAGEDLLSDGAQAATGVRPPDALAAEPALGVVAEQVYAGLPPAGRDMMRDMLLRLVDVRDDTQLPRAAGLGELTEGLPDPAPQVLTELEQASLVRITAGTVTMGKAALLHAWPRLHEWISAEHETIGRHRRLGEAAYHWAANGHHPEDLLQGSALNAALTWTSSARVRLNPTETEFVRTSRARSLQRRRRRRLVSAGMAVLLVASLTGGALAWQQSLRSDESDRRLAEQRAQVTARRLALQADALRDRDPAKAMLLSVAAYRVADVPEARAAVLSSLGQQQRHVFTDPIPANTGRALSEDGRILVSAGGGRVTAYDVRTGKTITTFTGVGQGPFSAALSPDGDTLALGGDGVRLWSLRTGKLLGGGPSLPGTYREDGGSGGEPTGLRFSPGGGYLHVFQNVGGPFRGLWNVARRKLELPQDAPPGATEVGNVVLGPGDRFGAVGDESGGGNLRNFTGDGPVEGRRLPGDLAGRVLAFSPDGEIAAVGGEEKVRLWNLSRGAWDERGLEGAGGEAVFSADGEFMVTFDAGTGRSALSLWRLSDAVQLLRLPMASTVVGPPRISADNRMLTVLDDSGQVTVYDIGRQTRPPRVRTDVTRLRSAADTLFGTTGGTVRTWSPPALTERDLKIKVGAGDEFDDVGLAVTPDGRTLATGFMNSSAEGVKLWDVTTRRPLLEIEMEFDGAEKADMEISPDGRLLAVSAGLPNDYHGEGTVMIVDLGRGKVVKRFRPVAGGRLSFSPDGATLVTADPGGVDVIDLRAGKVLPRAKGPGTLAREWMVLAPAGSLAVSPYGTGAVTLWDTRTWKPAGQLFRLPGRAQSAEFSPDGRLLAVAHGTQVTVFDVATGQQLGAPLGAAVSGETDYSVDAPFAAFSRDGGTLYMLGPDGGFQSVPLDPRRALPEVCGRAGRSLTSAEWQEHVGGDTPYVKVC
ncbi:WD40 repeat domain-containing serine/threonine protein kinase [Planobispora siamensis]|uniref:Protein kinase domain-containing protein n=1 Tax=Planobispora siamensis TaxID=936338 RepID=A0A8J3SL18_9ACTN|nr:protein kinase [Planobispora siamensis]GIH94299.1 hypothetical protein Psi01_49290 [Planobispora siamensis]